MSTRYVLLAVLMFTVTYPSRALPLIAPGLERLPAGARTYLRLVGPAVLAALAATTSLVTSGPAGRSIEPGITAASVALCAAVMIRRRNLLLGLIAAVGLAALVRALG